MEFAVTAAPVENGSRTITLDMVQQVAVRTAMRYDKLGDDLMEFDAQTFVESLLPESALQKDEKKEEGESEA